MSEETHARPSQSFAIVIAVTALILAVASGVVNYRQNNLAGLESSLRDTKDQLQLAKNDITDIKMKTIQQLLDAELSVRGLGKLKQENSSLRQDLSDANARIAGLEIRTRQLDDKLTARNKKNSKSTPTAISKKPVAQQSATVNAPKVADAATTDLDIYTLKTTPALRQEVTQALSRKGFKGKYLPPSGAMKMAGTTTVFYYDKDYKAVAESLLATLTAITRKKVVLKKGSSPYPPNKIIVHIVGR